MTTDEFKQYQRSLNHIRENKLKEDPLPTAKQLLEPEIKLNIDISDLTLENLPLNITPPVQNTIIEDKPVKSNSNSKSLF